MNRREVLAAVGVAALLPVCDVFAAAPVAHASSRRLPAFDAAMRIGPAQGGVGNHRHAEILGGEIEGTLLHGRIESGRMDWHVDPASGAVEVATVLQVRRGDGTSVQLRDRTVHSSVDEVPMPPGLATAPQLFDATGRLLSAPASLAGRLDNTLFSSGAVRLRAFRL